MAKRDLILRYAQIEHEYLEMTGLLKELQEDLKNNRINIDYYTNKAEAIENEINTIKTQYFLWGEVIFELNKPNKKSKKLSAHEQAWYNELTTATRACLKDTSQDALKELKKIIKEISKDEIKSN